MKRAPAVLVVAGLEPTGSAGLLADVAAVSGNGGRPLGVASALTAQGPTRFHLERVQPRTLRAQVEACLEGRRIDAVKLGMIPDRACLEALWRALEPLRVPVVVDPVVRTSLGQALSTLTARDYLGLAGPRVWITPNLDELAWLLGEPSARSLQPGAAAAALAAQGFGAVVVKGGHRLGPPVDLLAARGRLWSLRGTRLRRPPKLRGTGCRFASALAVALGQRQTAVEATRAARRWVRRYLVAQAPR